jgi:hypothetical protein
MMSGRTSQLLFGIAWLTRVRKTFIRLRETRLHTVKRNRAGGINLRSNGLIDRRFRLCVHLAMDNESNNCTNNNTCNKP